ncbi:hypothetical protein ACFSUS_10295 [Spirosoma soli]|uniref:Uncharacterized protein n=1 Tax=Spirosoma soli TaxID=1770529 RepID=A0ABW5M311_9BACT
MKKVNWLMLFLVCGGWSTGCLAQSNFQQCTAAFIDSKMVVNEYSPTGKCTLPLTSTGELSVQTVELSPTSTKALDKIVFRVAIRDKDTKTLFMYSSDEYRQIPLRNVLTKCQQGDHIVLLTVDKQYSLPHNEILVR